MEVGQLQMLLFTRERKILELKFEMILSRAIEIVIWDSKCTKLKYYFHFNFWFEKLFKIGHNATMASFALFPSFLNSWLKMFNKKLPMTGFEPGSSANCTTTTFQLKLFVWYLHLA